MSEINNGFDDSGDIIVNYNNNNNVIGATMTSIVLNGDKNRDLERGQPAESGRPGGDSNNGSGNGGCPATGGGGGGGGHRHDRSSASAASRPSVGRLLRRLLVAMLALGALAALLAALYLQFGPIFLLQLVVVALVAYLVAGGRFTWCYVAARTAPRDLRAIIRYVKLLWTIRAHERKDRSVADVFRQHVLAHPHKPCLIYEEQEWTFQQLEDYSNRLATVFRGHGYKKGDVVALLLENRPEFVGVWLGLSKLGIIVPLINTNLRKSTLLHSVNVAECQALIYGADLAEAVKDIAGSLSAKLALYRLADDPKAPSDGLKERELNALLADAPSGPPAVQDKGCYGDKLMYIYTSGTTGLPKAAVITNSRFVFIASGIHYIGGFRDSDRFYTPLPLYHTAGGVMTIGQALLHGSTVVIRKRFSASAYFADCKKYNCTIAQYIGEMCRYILAVPPKPEDKEHNVRMIFGNGLRPQIWHDFVERFGVKQVVEFYGATEGNANIVNVDNTVGAIGFVSRILPQVYPISIIRVDANGEPVRNSKGLCQVCEPDEPGVFIGKIIPNNPTRAFLGYADKKASKSKIVHDVFKKGDTAFISGDILVADKYGYLFFKDRTGDTFRWKGENVSTSEVEAIVSNLINYKDCIVYGVEVPSAEGRAGMAAIYDPEGALDISRLASDIKEQLPTYARPQFLRILTKIDLTGTFKLKKKDLQVDGFDPRKIRDKLYYMDPKLGYQLLTPDVYNQIESGKIRF